MGKVWVLRSLPPETLQNMPRWVFASSCVSLPLEIGHLSHQLTYGQGSGIFTPTHVYPLLFFYFNGLSLSV